MYNTFFGFKEKPFTLNPDPEYIFLSKSHEDVLSHLIYSIHEGNGFAKITGKVGSGKTLLCRTFLESLDQDVASAYIFNPKLDSIQLLKAINDEFGIDSTADNAKDLIDKLNAFLIKKKTEGKKAVLLIDEAQDLSIEALEQIRLLSNLETVKNKLMTIVLVGQSELNSLLERYELRQLAQRISLSCEMTSLSFSETNDYIIHRLHIASRRRGDIFSKDAVKRIYEYSKGVPRLINIICDRMLLTAFSNNSKNVTKKIAEMTLNEIRHTGEKKRIGNAKIFIIGVSALLVMLLLFFVIKTNGGFIDFLTVKKEGNASLDAGVKVAEEKKDVKLETESLYVEKSNLEIILSESSAITAVKDVIKLWNVGELKESDSFSDYLDSDRFFISIGQYNGFMVKKIENDIELIEKLNLPAILEFNPVESEVKKFVVLTGIAGNKKDVILKSGEKNVTVSIEDLYNDGFSCAYVFWRNFFNITGTPPDKVSPSSMSSLKILLRNIGFKDLIPNYSFDEETYEAIMRMQKKHGLTQDGVVGSLTKIILYNELGALNIPHIRFEKETSRN